MIPSAQLCDVASVTMGTAPPGDTYNERSEGMPMIAGAGDYGDLYPHPKKWTTAPTRIAVKGDLIVCVRATIGDLNWADREYCLGRGVAGIRAHQDKLDIRYLAHYIDSNKAELSKLGTGSTFLAIRRADLEEFPIPLPPLPEQRRIAAILDKADAIRRKRQRAIALTEDFLRSEFLEMFGDPVTNPKGWEIKELSKVCSKITDGVHAKPSYTSSGIPFISVKNITTGRLLFDQCKFISFEDHEKYIKRCKPEYMDILYTKVGATYGRPALIDTNREFSIYVSVALIKPDKKVINPHFLKEVLASPAIKSQADRSIKGIGVPDLHLIEIKSFLVPVPPMDVQNSFLTKTMKIQSKLSHLREFFTYSQSLFDSLSNRAFRGELTTAAAEKILKEAETA